LLEVIATNKTLHGLYHVAAEPIDKYSLLNLVSDLYNKAIDILPNEEVVIDRSLDGNKFARATGYVAKPWITLIETLENGKTNV
jgi:dTDP-4-dehydrorhamnose reductase